MPRHKADAAGKARWERKQSEKKFGPKIKKPIKKSAQTSPVVSNTGVLYNDAADYAQFVQGWVSYKFSSAFSIPVGWPAPSDPEAYEQTTIDFSERKELKMYTYQMVNAEAAIA